MHYAESSWDYTLLGIDRSDGVWFVEAEDIDGDGLVEVVAGGTNGLTWYRPATFERGLASTEGSYHDGIAIADIDGDGIKEVFVAELLPGCKEEKWILTWYKPGKNINGIWERYILDPACTGGAHDIIFADIDGDGENELIAIACFVPGIFAYKKPMDVKLPWLKYQIAGEAFAEGLNAADVNGDGQLEIICGPDLYLPPVEGPFSGMWTRITYAPGFREMCRTSVIDITGNGRPDIVTVESEYMEGRLSWFENRMVENPENPWIEHRMENSLIFAHSLDTWKENRGNEIHVFVAEMAEGGWDAPYNYYAKLVDYISTDRGNTWKGNIIYRGEGTHLALARDVDGDGIREIIGECCFIPKVQMWKKRLLSKPGICFRHRFLDRKKTSDTTDIIAVDIDGDGLTDIACGKKWYRSPNWECHELAEGFHVVSAFDVDSDGKEELLAFGEKPDAKPEIRGDFDGKKSRFGCELYWIKPANPIKNTWEAYPAGRTGKGRPTVLLAAPLLPGGKPALVVGCRGYDGSMHIEILKVPPNPKTGPWLTVESMEIEYCDGMTVCDINCDGLPDIVAGSFWLENAGDGTFSPRRIFGKDFRAAYIAVADINGDGWPDIIAGEDILDYGKKMAPLSNLAWFENPGLHGKGDLWEMHVIDKVRCAHSLNAGDFDKDGMVEIICGEHNPFKPYRSQCRLYLYKKADSKGESWNRYTIDDRFEHYNGAKVFRTAQGRIGIVSCGQTEKDYLHLWESM